MILQLDFFIEAILICSAPQLLKAHNCAVPGNCSWAEEIASPKVILSWVAQSQGLASKSSKFLFQVKTFLDRHPDTLKIIWGLCWNQTECQRIRLLPYDSSSCPFSCILQKKSPNSSHRLSCITSSSASRKWMRASGTGLILGSGFWNGISWMDHSQILWLWGHNY